MSTSRRVAAARFAYLVMLSFLLFDCLSFALAGDNRVIKSKTAGAMISEANRAAEITLVAEKEHADPFNDVVLDAVFTTPQGKKLKVPAFWAGGRTWRVRYSSPEVGEHRFLTVCSHTSDKGLDGVAGKIEVRPYSGNNLLYRHGPIRVAADRRHFEHLDGTAFFWLGDTWWMGLCQRLGWPGEFKILAADRKTKGFNVVQIVAGLYPDMGAFDERGRNEAGFPWEKDYRRIRPAYFDKADERLQYLADQGLVPCLCGLHILAENLGDGPGGERRVLGDRHEMHAARNRRDRADWLRFVTASTSNQGSAITASSSAWTWPDSCFVSFVLGLGSGDPARFQHTAG
jgi:Protein of unknown function (DUF4038)/Domain of unknown function (DUF5060)